MNITNRVKKFVKSTIKNKTLQNIHYSIVERNPYMRCKDIYVNKASRTKQNPLYAGERVKFTCDTGYHVLVGVTEQTFDCLPLNTWSTAPETGRPVLDCKSMSI